MPVYKLQEGEDLTTLARRFLGDGRLWRELGYKGRPEDIRAGVEVHLPIDGPKRQPPLIQPLHKRKSG